MFPVALVNTATCTSGVESGASGRRIRSKISLYRRVLSVTEFWAAGLDVDAYSALYQRGMVWYPLALRDDSILQAGQ